MSNSACSHCGAMPGEGHVPGCPRLKVDADARALADVRTLDEWAGMRPLHDPDRMAGWKWSLVDEGVLDAPDRFMCELRNLRCPEDEDGECFTGPTPDAARAKAAAWVREQAEERKAKR
jgi:hypothetical protein